MTPVEPAPPIAPNHPESRPESHHEGQPDAARGTTRRTALIGAASTIALVGAAAKVAAAGAPSSHAAVGLGATPTPLATTVPAAPAAVTGVPMPTPTPVPSTVPSTVGAPASKARAAARAASRATDAAATAPAPSAATAPAPSAATAPSAASAPAAQAPAGSGSSVRAPGRSAAANAPSSSSGSVKGGGRASSAPTGSSGSGPRRAQPPVADPDGPIGPEIAPLGYAAMSMVAVPAALGPVKLDDPVRTLLRKASFGYTPAELARARTIGIDAWIEEQLDPALADPTGTQAWAMFPLAGASIAGVRSRIRESSWDAMYETAQGALARQIYSRRQLFEVLVDVFTNRLHVPIPANVWSTGPDYYQQVIRRHALGTYEDMLLAAGRHPAMLRYLSNDLSNRTKVNENLGRELLELHTVGVDSGYTEDEVKCSAAILSGRTLDRNDQFFYDPRLHAVTPVRVLGFQNANVKAEDGLALGDDYLRHLARHPSTARSVARTLAQRFVSDNPPAQLVDAMAATYLATGTSISETVRTMFRHEAFWSSAGQKVNRAHEDTLATTRILAPRIGTGTKDSVIALYWATQETGMPVLGWDAPNGFPDVGAAWLSAGGLLARWNMHRKLTLGWFGGLGHTLGDLLVPEMESLTVAQFVDRLALRLLDQPVSATDRATLIAASGYPSTQVIVWRRQHVAAAVVPLLLDSIYFQVR